MPKLSEHQSNDFVKFLYMGDSGTGKTGSMLSLLKAGYKLRVLDFDNGLDILKNLALTECPDMLDNLSYIDCRDEFKASTTGGIMVDKAVGLMEAGKALNKWEDDTVPQEWGKDHILVIDSLSGLGRVAYNWADKMNPNSKDKRQVFYTAQTQVLNLLQKMTDARAKFNLIIIAHVNYLENEAGAIIKGVPKSIGKAIASDLNSLFNTAVMAEVIGSGQSIKRQIRTVSTGLVTLKTSNPKDMANSYPLETGLIDVFENLKGVKNDRAEIKL